MATTRPLLFGAAAAVLAILVSAQPARGSPTPSALEEAEHLALEAGLVDPASLRPRPDAVAAISQVLAEIRAGYPATRDIFPQVPRGTAVSLRLKDPAPCPEAGPHRVAPSTPPPVPEDISRLTAQFGGTSRCLSFLLRGVLLVKIPALVHAPSLAQLYRTLPSVADVEADSPWTHVAYVPSLVFVVPQTGGGWRAVLQPGGPWDRPRDLYCFAVDSGGRIQRIDPCLPAEFIKAVR